MTTTRDTMLPRIALVALALVTVGGVAHAQRVSPLEGKPPIMRRVEMRDGRFELSPQFMFSANEDFRQFVGVSIVAQYHINDWLGIAAQAGFGGGMDTGLTGRLVGDSPEAANGTLPATENGLQPSAQQFYAHLASIQYVMSLYAALTPFAGKLQFFGTGSLHYDTYVMIGFGGMGLTNSYTSDQVADSDCASGDPNRCLPQNAGFKAGGMFGLGVHLFFNDWFGLNLEARDWLASTNMGGLDVNRDRKLTSDDDTIANHLFFSVGVTFMLPPTAHISK